MTQEEKAKAYDKALERARNLYKDAVEMENNMTAKTCEIIFPELKESEGDSISKELIYFLSRNTFQFGEDIDKYKSWIAWLEKQGQVKESLISQHENKTCKENGNSLTSEDERIRKVLVELVKGNERCGYFIINNITTSSMLAWLERQGQKEATWNKEDEENMNNILYILNQLKDTSSHEEDDIAEKAINWFKSLKYRLSYGTNKVISLIEKKLDELRTEHKSLWTNSYIREFINQLKG